MCKLAIAGSVFAFWTSEFFLLFHEHGCSETGWTFLIPACFWLDCFFCNYYCAYAMR